MVKTQTIAFSYISYSIANERCGLHCSFLFTTLRNNGNTITFERRTFMKNERFNTPPFMGGYDKDKTKLIFLNKS